MTRVDTEMRTPEDRESLKREIADEIRSDATLKRRKGCIILLVIVALLIITPLAWFATVAARTGLVHVPVLSSWLYSPAAPSRTVAPLIGATPTDIVQEIGSRSKYDPDNGLVTTSASEQELTTLIRQVGDGGDASSPFILDQAQIAVEEGYIEVAAEMAQNGTKVPVIVKAMPYAKDGELELDLQSVVIGGYAVPDAMVDAAYGAFGEQLLNSVRTAVEDLGTVWRVQLTEGSVAVTFLPKAEDTGR